VYWCCIWVVPYSNLGWDSCCLIFFVVFGHLENRGIVSQATAASFIVFSTLSFTSYTFLHYALCSTDQSKIQYNKKRWECYTSMFIQLTFRNRASYMLGQAHRYPPNTPFYVFFQQIYVLNFLNMLHTLHFLLFKMLFIS
jgi:hypothetical protein